MVLTTDGLFQVAIESRPEFDWNPRPLNSVQMLQLTEPSGYEFNSHSEPTLYSYTRFIVCLLWHFILAVCLHELRGLFQSKFFVGNQMSVAEWADTYGIYHWRILWRSYRKLAWVVFEPATTEVRSDALTNWAIRPWVQVALRANFV